MLKVCKECTTAYAASLEQCPHCRHTEYVWNTDLPDGWRELIDSATTTLEDILAGEEEKKAVKAEVQEEGLQRPADSADKGTWFNYAKKVLLASDQPIDGLDTMTKPDLIALVG